MSFSGFLWDNRHIKRVHLEGEKIYDPALILEKDTLEGRKKIIELFLNGNLLEKQNQNLQKTSKIKLLKK